MRIPPTVRAVAATIALTMVAAACAGDDAPSASSDDGRSGVDGDAAAGAGSAPIDTSGNAEPPGHIAQAVGPWNTDWSKTTIDVEELALGLRGVDPRDGIPPIDDPAFQSLDEAAEWLSPNQPGSAVEIDGEARFYPLAILTAHEIVNDRFADRPVAVTYCPLCNTALTFDRVVDGEELRFGVSGLLRKSDLVMWDDATDSLWQQITGEGIVGTYAGTQLDIIPSGIVSFEQFGERYPDGVSLDPESARGDGAYGSNPYVGYSSQSAPISGFFSDEVDDRFPALDRVVGVSIGDEHKAFPFETLAAEYVVNDTVGGRDIAVFWGGDTADALDAASIADSMAIGSAVAYDATVDGAPLTFDWVDGEIVDDQTGSTWTVLGEAVAGELAGSSLEPVVHRNEFWFAWSGFFPDGSVYGR